MGVKIALLILGIIIGIILEKIHIHRKTVGQICKLKKVIDEDGDMAFGLVFKDRDSIRKLNNGTYVLMEVVEKRVKEDDE